MGILVKSYQITENLIKLDLIKTIQFYSNIYDLWTNSPHLGGCMEGWMGWMGGSVDGFMSN